MVYRPFSVRERLATMPPQPLTYELTGKCRSRIAYVLDHAGLSADEWRHVTREIQLTHGQEFWTDFKRNTAASAEFCTSDSEFLDLVEVTCRAIRNSQQRRNAIELVNRFFEEYAVGYSFDTDVALIVRLDSDLAQKEIIAPVVSLLRSAQFEGPEDEFVAALDAFRSGDARGAVTKAHAAFESTMKAIAAAKGWPYEGLLCKKLVALMFDQAVLPAYLESELAALRTMLESGLPTIRNKEGAHGQGPEVVELPQHRAWFALQLAAANIQLLVRSFEAMP